MSNRSAVDRATGALTIQQPPMVLGSEMTRALFAASPLGLLCRRVNEHAPWSVLGIAQVQIGGEMFSGTICFYDERVEYVTLVCGRLEFSSGLADLSKEKEQARQLLHNEWLTRQVPDHPVMASAGSDAPAWTWLFPWGRIVSGWDVKNGTTEIVIRYRQDGQELALSGRRI